MHWRYCSLSPSHRNPASCMLLRPHVDCLPVSSVCVSEWVGHYSSKFWYFHSRKYSWIIKIIHYEYTLEVITCKVQQLTHWGRVTHICVSKLTIIASDNGLSPGRRQAIIWTNAGILLIGTLRTNFSEIWIEIHTVSFKKIHLKMSSGKWQTFCLGLNVLTTGRV